MYAVMAGVPQGSVLGPSLWNLMDNGVVWLPVDKQAVYVGFADDVGVVIISSHPDEVEICANEVSYCLKDHGQELAEHKTELSFKPHLKLTGQKAATISSTLGRMLPNVGGLKHSQRLLLLRVVRCVLSYTAPVRASR